MSDDLKLPISAAALASADDASLLSQLHAARLRAANARAARRTAQSGYDLQRAIALLAASDERNAPAREARADSAESVITARAKLDSAENELDLASAMVDVLDLAAKLRRREGA